MWCLVGDASIVLRVETLQVADSLCKLACQRNLTTFLDFSHTADKTSCCCYCSCPLVAFSGFSSYERVNINKTSVDLIEVNKSFEGAPSPSSFFLFFIKRRHIKKIKFVCTPNWKTDEVESVDGDVNKRRISKNEYVSFLLKSLLRAKGKKKH